MDINCKKLQDKLKQPMQIKLIPIVTVCLSLLFIGQVHAEQWKNCKVVNSLATEKEAAIAFGKIEKRLSFFKKTDFASITIFLDGKTWKSADLIQTGRRLFGDGKPYLGYADKTNSLIVQEFEESELLIVKLRGDVDFTMFAECR